MRVIAILCTLALSSFAMADHGISISVAPLIKAELGASHEGACAGVSAGSCEKGSLAGAAFVVNKDGASVGVEVIGIKAGVGTSAIYLTGNPAAYVAQAAGKTIDTSKEMLVITGTAAYDILNKTTSTAWNFGKATVVAGHDLTQWAVATSVSAVSKGLCTVKGAAGKLTEGAIAGVKLLYQTGQCAVTTAVTTGAKAVGFVLDAAISPLCWVIGCCKDKTCK